ncbi:MAG: hypothetical protein L6425_10245, partial [Candidatus Aminicenantes bacterium]|nr:hypothetical protein [Candidatus Aminicenantes bacterium]
MFKRIIGIVFLCLLIASPYGFAAETPPIKKEASEIETGKLVTSRHNVRIGGADVPYTATVGELIINKADEKPGAAMYF